MGLRQDGEAGKLSPGDLQLRQATGPICSLNEAWFRALNKCVTDTPLGGSILPSMRSCFFGGAMHAVFLLQKVMTISWLPILPASSWNSRSREIQRLAYTALSWGCATRPHS
jgi:hypothetical protein